VEDFRYITKIEIELYIEYKLIVSTKTLLNIVSITLQDNWKNN